MHPPEHTRGRRFDSTKMTLLLPTLRFDFLTGPPLKHPQTDLPREPEECMLNMISIFFLGGFFPPPSKIALDHSAGFATCPKHTQINPHIRTGPQGVLSPEVAICSRLLAMQRFPSSPFFFLAALTVECALV